MGAHQVSNWHVQVRLATRCWQHEKTDNFPQSFTGLTTPQTKALAEKAHIYMTADGRISMAGLNSGNIDYFAESVDSAVRGKL